MNTEKKKIKCPECASFAIRKNGRRRGKQCYQCRSCGRQFVESPSSNSYPLEVKKLCLKIHRNGMSLREIERITNIHHTTIMKWLRDANIETLKNAK